MKSFFLVAISLTFIQLAQAQTVGNFHNFGEGLYRGARPTDAVSIASLQAIGVKTVIDLQGSDTSNPALGWVAGRFEPGESPRWIAYEKSVIEGLGMNFVNVPLNSLDDVTNKEAQSIEGLLKFMSTPANQPLFIHCEHGKDRTGLVVALYRVFFEGWSAQAAHDEMVALGHSTTSQIFTHDMDEFFWSVTKGK